MLCRGKLAKAESRSRTMRCSIDIMLACRLSEAGGR